MLTECPHCYGGGDFICPSCRGTGITGVEMPSSGCPECRGTGGVVCYRCDGTGEIEVDEDETEDEDESNPEKSCQT